MTARQSVIDAVQNKDRGRETNPVDYYDGIITSYEREFKKWETRAEKVVKRYRDEQRVKAENDHTKFNILWSNVQTLIPAVYSRVPQPDVSRRHKDNDPVGRVAGLILERSLEYEVGNYPFYKESLKRCVQDRFLPGRGTSWIRYEPHFRAAPGQPEDGVEATEDIDRPNEELDYECTAVDYVHWKDFGHNVARTWDEVFMVFRAVYLTREAAVERFGEDLGNKIPLDTKPEEKKSNWTEDDRQYRALVYEIWDKQANKAYWLSKSMKKMLDERDDPLGLKDFFPCPRPLYATLTNESLVPVPDFTLYQDQAAELDTLADRIDGLVRMLQVKGTYDGAIPELARLFTEGVNGTLIPVKNYAAYAEKRGLAGGTDIFDLKPIYEALNASVLAMKALKEDIYEITGISDIVRGQSAASETLGAQKIKENFVGLRLRSMQSEVAEFATEILQMMAQTICGKYDPQTIATIAGVAQLSPADQQYVPQAMALLVGEQRLADPTAADSPNPTRAFRIEIASDTLVQMDEQAEQAATQELLMGMGQFLGQAAQVGAAAPQLVPFFIETLKWAMSKYKAGKTLEGTLDMALDQMKQAQQQRAMQPPPPDPKLMVEQAKTQAIGMKAHSDVAVAQQKAQIDQQKGQADIAMQGQKMQMDAQQHQQDMAFKGAANQQKLHAASQQAALKIQTARAMPKKPAGRPQ